LTVQALYTIGRFYYFSLSWQCYRNPRGLRNQSYQLLIQYYLWMYFRTLLITNTKADTMALTCVSYNYSKGSYTT